MKKTILLLLILISVTLKAQRPSANKDTAFLNFYYGYRTHFQNFYNQLNTVESFQLSAPLQIAGLRVSGMFPFKINYFEIAYGLIIPLRERLQDTLTCNISGYTYGAAIGRIMRSKHATFSYYAGLSFGRTIIYGNRSLLRKNPFVSPKVGISPGLKFGNFGIALTVEYEYDITNPNWKKTLFSKDVQPVDRLRQTAITTCLGLRYDLIDKKSNE